MDRAREIAMLVLKDVHENGAYANVSLLRTMKKEKISDIDRRFATELVYGAVKAGETLDWIIGKYADRLMKKMSPYVREVLRLGIFQLFYLDKIPASAACNEAVELIKKYEPKNIGAAKFVNAVLRNAVREPDRAAFPNGKGHATEYLSLSSMHPYWLVKKWIEEFGYDDAKKICDFDNSPAVLSLRANTLKTTRNELLAIMRGEGAEVEPSSWSPDGILCHGHGSLDEMNSLKEGLWQAQDESSMMVSYVVAPRPNEVVIDACAAPGGKSTHIAAMMKNEGRVISCDIYPSKIERIEENASRLGINIIEAICLDARDIGVEYSDMADRVIVDAPCSGLGVLRRRPDARWRKTKEDLSKLPSLQLEILEGASGAVKSGGVLVYSTCTMNEAENENVVNEFLSAHDDFVLENAGRFLPIKKRDDDMLHFYPQRDGIDGFFIARMRRKV
ncbi:MAG: 16S rRNA (cytosine(967)-C(5))-methyltransferase RsmB [Schwartzia sp.]|nr:16S rRNA (cytosine(967)-C(5))-methyltransferase RsmB [Schwartzia sp. (in: firmicutes)]